MAAVNFRIIFTFAALSDLEEIVAYWQSRGEPKRGEQYAHELSSEAISQLSEPAITKTGRFWNKTSFPEVQALPTFLRSYHVLYRIREDEGIVETLRFWHSHRGPQFRD